MTINFSWQLTDDEAALFEQFVATEGKATIKDAEYLAAFASSLNGGRQPLSRISRVLWAMCSYPTIPCSS